MGIFQVQYCILCNVAAFCDLKIFSKTTQVFSNIDAIGFLVEANNRAYVCVKVGEAVPNSQLAWIR